MPRSLFIWIASLEDRRREQQVPLRSVRQLLGEDVVNHFIAPLGISFLPLLRLRSVNRRSKVGKDAKACSRNDTAPWHLLRGDGQIGTSSILLVR